jgi:hypothetical protein
MVRSSEPNYPAYSPHESSNCAGYQLGISNINTGRSVAVPDALCDQTRTSSAAAHFTGCAFRHISLRRKQEIIDEYRARKRSKKEKIKYEYEVAEKIQSQKQTGYE